jgi:hypothetical protein
MLEKFGMDERMCVWETLVERALRGDVRFGRWDWRRE